MFVPDYSYIPPEFKYLKRISDIFLYSSRYFLVNGYTVTVREEKERTSWKMFSGSSAWNSMV